MTAESKAKELVLKFVCVPDNAMKENSNAAWIDTVLAKQCAIIAVEEILIAIDEENKPWVNYWQQVLHHIKTMK